MGPVKFLPRSRKRAVIKMHLITAWEDKRTIFFESFRLSSQYEWGSDLSVPEGDTEADLQI